MPRQPRLDVPGALHHIMVRGNNKVNIFSDDQDRSKFLQRLGQNITEAKCSVYAWVLMSNHVHILFKSGKKGISAVMRKLLTWYAVYYNHRHRRSGHLFENRYKSILCEEDRYLLALIRYIHLNPMSAGMVKTLEELDRYPWSGHSVVMEKNECPWMDVNYILLQFNDTKRKAKNAYRKFVEEGIALGRSAELTGGGLIRSRGGWSQVVSARRKGQREEYDERILGSGDFVNEIFKEAEKKEMRQMKIRRSGKTITNIIKEECTKNQVSLTELQAGSRRKIVSDIRTTIAKRSLDELGVSMAGIARHLGVNTSSITRTIAKIEKRGGDSYAP
jgi:REP-associated tyrosine transposase